MGIFISVIWNRHRPCQFCRIWRRLHGFSAWHCHFTGNFLSGRALKPPDSVKAPNRGICVYHRTSVCKPDFPMPRICHRIRRKNQLHCAAYHGRCLRRYVYQRSGEIFCKTGMENDPDRSLCHDRYLPFFCHYFTDHAVCDRCDLTAFS